MYVIQIMLKIFETNNEVNSLCPVTMIITLRVFTDLESKQTNIYLDNHITLLVLLMFTFQ